MIENPDGSLTLLSFVCEKTSLLVLVSSAREKRTLTLATLSAKPRKRETPLFTCHLCHLSTFNQGKAAEHALWEIMQLNEDPQGKQKAAEAIESLAVQWQLWGTPIETLWPYLTRNPS